LTGHRHSFVTAMRSSHSAQYMGTIREQQAHCSSASFIGRLLLHQIIHEVISR
jgi:hypothetical protein